jgi:hypothetical protein
MKKSETVNALKPFITISILGKWREGPMLGLPKLWKDPVT